MNKRAHDLTADYQQGLALHRAGRHAEAQRLYRAVLKRAPMHVEALHFLGLSLCQNGKFGEALPLFDRALAQRPGWVEALINRGNALQQLGRPGPALADFDAALALAPAHPEALCNRGITLYSLGRQEEALADYEGALALRAAYPEALTNRGNALRALKRNAEAVACYEAAIALKPDDAEAHLYLGMSRLLLGDYAGAWPEYHWRWKTPEFARQRRDFAQPEWLGHRALTGRSLLLHAEQGYGDTLQFCRFAAAARDLGARVVLEVPPALKRLLQGLEGTSQVLARGEPLPECDFHCPLLSLPGALGVVLETLPAALPYVHADPALVAAWAEQLPQAGPLRVGVAWAGNPRHIDDANRSARLADYEALFALPASFVSLQKPLTAADRQQLRAWPNVSPLGEHLADFADTAAAIAQLDLVITVDTAVAHLAGALGKPAWVLLPFAPDWRWLLERRDSPWYPGMRLFRQPARGDWDAVMTEVAAALRALAQAAL